MIVRKLPEYLLTYVTVDRGSFGAEDKRTASAHIFSIGSITNFRLKEMS
jgi:hypothetical protein